MYADLKVILKGSFVSTHLGFSHWFHSLSHPLDVSKLHSGNIVHQVSLKGKGVVIITEGIVHVCG